MIRHIFLATVSFLALTLGAAGPGWAQTFQQVPNIGLLQVIPGAVSVWGMWACQGCVDNATYRFVAGQFQQVLTPTPFAHISVGGGSVMQFDEVWATDFNNNVFQWDNYAQTFHQVVGSMQDVEVAQGYSACHPYEVWGTDANHEVWRFNYCTHSFDLIGGFFNGLATGGGEVWALNGYNQVFRFNFSTNQFDLLPGTLTQISVGAGGVWGLNTPPFDAWTVWQFDPSTQNWQQLPLSLNVIAAGSDGVFGFHDSNSWGDPNYGYRLNASTRTWTVVYTITKDDINQIAPGTGAGTWMIAGLIGPTYYYLSY
jgi:hypothetical protein